MDDPVFATMEAKANLKSLLLTAVGDVLFVEVLPHMYGKVRCVLHVSPPYPGVS